MTRKLDCIICPIDTNNFAADDPDARMSEQDARAVADGYGWDASESNVIHLDPSQIEQHIAANGARKRVRDAAAWAGPDEWISCFVVTWEDLDD